MKRYINPDREQWGALTERAMTDDAVIEARVNGIVARVKADGDKAIMELAAEIDSVDLSAGIEVTAEEIASASQGVSEELKQAVSEKRFF